VKIPASMEGKRPKVIKQFAMDVTHFCSRAIQKNRECSGFNSEIDKFYNREVLKSGKKLEAGTKAMSFDGDDIMKTIILLGGRMENTKEELKMVSDEVKKSKQELEKLYNELIVLDNEVTPILLNQIKTVRETRMTVEREIKSMLTTLKEIRTFFLENEYEKEVKRLYEFIGICKDLKKLQEDGTLDAISETIIKLALKGGKND